MTCDTWAWAGQFLLTMVITVIVILTGLWIIDRVLRR